MNAQNVLERSTPKLRWSSVRDCPRKAVYEATNAPARERTDRENRILYRGKSLGREYADFLRHRYGPDAVTTEIPVPWPLGIGHIDILLHPTETMIEVLSSAHASDAMIRSKLLQLVGYLEHYDGSHGPARNGALIVLNPSDFTDEVFPVARTTRTYAALVDEMRARVATVQAWADTGTLPDRVCAKPADARSHFCLYPGHCFDGWEPPPLNELIDEETVEMVERLYHAKQREHAVKGELKLVESERKEIEQRLADIVPVGKHRVGGIEVARSHVQRGPTVDVKKAELAGFPVDTLELYMKPGASFDTWRVDRVADHATGEDFGEQVPF